jgi:hypothetical protein
MPALLVDREARSTCDLERRGGRTELAGGDVCHDRRLADSVRGMARRPTTTTAANCCSLDLT